MKRKDDIFQLVLFSYSKEGLPESLEMMKNIKALCSNNEDIKIRPLFVMVLEEGTDALSL